MKTKVHFLTLGAALLAFLSGCSKAPESKTAEETSPSEAPSETSTPPPSQPAESPKVAEVPAKPKLAPEGVYFLRQAASVETDAGIVGVKRGSQLTKTAEGKFRTPAGDEVSLSPDQVTNDLEEIRQILTGEQASAAQVATWKLEQQKAAAAAAKATPSRKTASTRPPAPPSAPPAPSNTAVSQPAEPAKPAAAPATSLGAAHSAQKRIGNAIFKKDEKGEWVYDRPIR